MCGSYISDLFGEFAFRLISKKIHTLVNHFGFNRNEREDLYQDFALNLCVRSAQYDPEIGTWEGLALVVIENHFANILEHRMAAMRSRRREAGSLSRPVDGSESGRCDRAGLLDETSHDRRTGAKFRSERERFEMSQDVVESIDGLSPLQRRICAALMRDRSVSAAARSLDISRSVVTSEIARIRERFEQADLRDYL